jgi:GNAT superfamily N-acetyltransferase
MPGMADLPPVTVRSADARDAEALEEVRGRSWRAAYRGLLPQAMIDEATGPGAAAGRRRLFAENPKMRALLAESDGAPVGMAAYGPDRPDGTRAELYALYVIPEHWSAGIGRRLLEQVIDELRAEGYAEISLWVLEGNARGRAFYERTGFTERERAVHERYGQVTHELCYVREL